MIVVDFLTLRMPGMLNQLSIFITHQKTGKNQLSIPFQKAVEWYSQGFEPLFGLDKQPSTIILPGLLFSFSFDTLLKNVSKQ